MKKLIIGLALTAMAATPALAQNHMMRGDSGASMQSDSDLGYRANHRAQGSTGHGAVGAYAYEPGSADGMTMQRPGVYQYGQYVGNDPDPAIRFQLQRVENGNNVD